MGESSIFWGGTAVGDATLAPYTDDQFSDFLRTLFVKDPTTQGVIAGYLNGLAGSGAVSPVSINTGAALVDGKFYENTVATTVVIPTPAVSPRYDRIVLRKGFVAQTVRITRIAGVEGAGVPALVQLDGVTWDIPLYTVYITTLGAITLTDNRVDARTRLAGSSDYRQIVEGRLTLTSGTPVTTADVTAAATLYFAPYLGSRIGLYYSGGWDLYEFTEPSLSLAALSDATNYDIFGYWTGSALALEALAWASATARATAIALQNGFWVKSGDATRRYLGTIRMSAAGQCEDSTSKRFVWNMYNRVRRYLLCKDTTNLWAYTTSAWREINGGSTLGTSRFAIVTGVSQEMVKIRAMHAVLSSSGVSASTGVGLDVSNANSAQIMTACYATSVRVPISAEYVGHPGIGYHYFTMLEYGDSNCVFYGDNNLTIMQTGMLGEATV